MKKWVWSGNLTITYCRAANSTLRKSHRTLTVTSIRKTNNLKSRATNAFFLVKIIPKIKWTQSNAYQKKWTQNPHKQWELHKTINQQQNNRHGTDISHFVSHCDELRTPVPFLNLLFKDVAFWKHWLRDWINQQGGQEALNRSPEFCF